MSWAEWARGQEVEPSLYSADLARLGDQVETLLDAGCRIFHFDVGDGHFQEAITMGPMVLQAVSPRVHARGGVMDVHLMVEDPATWFGAVREAGGDSVTFHYEAAHDVPGTIAAARERGLAAGVAFIPETEPDDVAAAAGDADLVLCMGIRHGDPGQPPEEAVYRRIERLRELLPERIHVQVDGGVASTTISRLRSSGASLFVAASSVFGRVDPAAAYDELERLIR
jgi:ribulose-phosphate 3-epimerase